MALWTRIGGAATLVYGPGDALNAHAADEHASLAEAVAVAATLVAAVHRIQAAPGV
jgi:acetylornithine deacetylase/succinyl-diaminopimelate desuccinylase-like protein